MSKAGRFSLAIEGIEATQAIQFYRSARHLDRATAEPDNAVPLVAGKPLALRVYPDLRAPRRAPCRLLVGGEAWWRGTEPGGDWRPAVRLNGPVPAERAASIDRGDPNQTLNFLIPGTFARGKLLIRVRLWLDAPGAGRLRSGWFRRRLRFIETRSLRLRLYGVRYRRNGRDVPPPSAADALETLNYVRKTYPVGRIEVVSYETIEFGENLTDRSGGECGAGWNKLLLLLHRLRAASLSSDLHYALLPRGVPVAGVSGGGSTLGVGASFAGEGSAMAQELGHVHLRGHAPGGGTRGVDPSYPEYNGYQPGSIGEYGFDCVTGEVFSPGSSHDFMSYGGKPWVSPYTYRGLLSHFVAPRGRTRGPVRTRLYLRFSHNRSHGIELVSGLTLPGPPLIAAGRESAFRLELRDRHGRILASRRGRLPDAREGLGSERLHSLGTLPFRDGARALVFRCCRRHPPTLFGIPRGTLSIKIASPALRRPGRFLGGRLPLEWKTVSRGAGRLSFFVRYTWDGGRSWQPVDIGLGCGSCEVVLDRLPGGERCRLQVIASTILETATAETPPFRVRRKPLKAEIAGAARGPRLESGRVVEFIGTAHSADGFAREKDLVWRSSLQGFLGRGSRLLLHSLVGGDHIVTLTAPDGMGGRTQAMTMVRIAPAAQDGAS